MFGCTTLRLPKEEPGKLHVFTAKKPIRIALVLGGGGSKGLAQLGAIKELEAAGIRPDLIVGCSAGSMIGAFYADDPTLATMGMELLKLKRSHLLDMHFFPSRFGLARGQSIQQFMETHLKAKTFEQLSIPLIVVATDLFTGEIIELSQEELPVAIRASCAYPGIFTPVLLHNRYLVDGGVSSPLPVEIAKKYGADLVIVIDVSEKLPPSKPSHLFGVAKRSMEIMYEKLVQQARAHADIVIKMDFQDVGMFSEHLNHYFYEHGRQQALQMIPAIKEALAKSDAIAS